MKEYTNKFRLSVIDSHFSKYELRSLSHGGTVTSYHLKQT